MVIGILIVQSTSNRCKMLLLKLSAAVIFMLLVGCATTYISQIEQYDAAAVCCNSIAELPYHELYLPDEKKVKIGDDGNAFEFDTGKSFFKAFKLVQRSISYSIEIRSYVTGTTASTWSIFVPTILLLDQNYTVVHTIGEEEFKYSVPSVSEGNWTIRAMLSATIEIPVKKEGVRYMVIMTRSDALKRMTTVTYPETISIYYKGMWTLPTGRQIRHPIPNSPMGHLKVVVQPSSDQ